MAFSISPGVNVSEVDLTTVIPSVLTTAGAFAGAFNWGPVDTRIQVSSESNMLQIFTKPDSNTYVSYYTAASFLAYGNNLKIVRSVGSTSYNADANTSYATTVKNEAEYEYSYLSGNNANVAGPFMARYPGALGNSLVIGVLDSSNTAAANATNASAWTVNGVNVGSYFSGNPGTSLQATSAGAANDEIHVVVLDGLGLFTGVKNQILEVFPYLSKASDAKDILGNSNYYKNYIFNNSNYIYVMDPPDYSNTTSTALTTYKWGTPLSNGVNYTQLYCGANNNNSFVNVSLTGGTDAIPTTANLQTSYDLFKNPDEVDVSLIITGDASPTVQAYVGNIAISRKDCIAFVSPPSLNVINKSASVATTNITTWATSLLATLSSPTNYVVADSGWKYMFDKHNNTYRWIPLNGDIAGLCVYTDTQADPWYSPAGFNRGNLKNVIKLAWNPGKSERDSIYTLGVNPVVTFPGQGTVLYGDKTFTTKPSAFDRINVRRLFIILEKTIAQASKYSLFEFNDEFTRSQFVALVSPFLRDIQGRRGIYDFRVVCDESNNTPEVIDSNRFVGDIYVKPARSINYIQLNFVAVRTGVSFNEVAGSI
jgi:hypothetical protein